MSKLEIFHEIDVYLYNYDSMIQLCFEIKIEKW